MPADTAPTSTIAISSGASCGSAPAVTTGAGDGARQHEQGGTRNGVPPTRDTRERDREADTAQRAEKRRERCGHSQPVAHDAPPTTIAPRYHAGRALPRAAQLRLGRVPGRHPRRLLLARPRGYCAGVERAVETVEQMLVLHGPPIYVRKQIVHNIHVVRRLEQQGAIFVESEEDVPEGATVVLSAHGVAPEVTATPRCGGCGPSTRPARWSPRSTRRPSASRASGYTIFLIGHDGHEEVVGTMGEAPDAIVLVQRSRMSSGSSRRPSAWPYLTQTTLWVDETAEIIAALRDRFPAIAGPPKDDICYATTNRQAAVKALAREVDLVLVIGSANSSNSQRLVDVTRDLGVAAHLIDDESQILERMARRASRPSASRRAHRRPSGSSSGWSTGSARAASRTSTSTT